VWHDAKFLADQIEIQRSYKSYSGTARIIQDLNSPLTSLGIH
jgi:hypothetical protein